MIVEQIVNNTTSEDSSKKTIESMIERVEAFLN